MNKILWYTISKEKVLDIFKVNENIGLNDSQVKENRSKFGTNTLYELKKTNPWLLLFEGLKQPMMLVLLSISFISFIFKEYVEAITMIVVVFLYVFVEFINKYRSDKIILSLKSLSQPTTKVIRNNKIQEVPTKDLVVGDIVLLAEGTYISADMRLLHASGLLINEASLTGESSPVRKDSNKIEKEKTPFIERQNCVFAGTYVLDGEGKGIVIAVGENTEFGKIAKQTQISKQEGRTLIQEEMLKLSKILTVVAVILSLLIPLIGFARGLNIKTMVLTWLSLTFLMIPGQPPIIITMALAVAAFELARKKVITKRLQGMERLGQVTSIVTDKTGTITENKMKLESLILPDGKIIQAKELTDDLSYKINLALPAYANDPTDTAVHDELTENKKEMPISFTGFTTEKQWRDLVYKKNGIFLHAIAGSAELLIENSELSSKQKDNLKKIIDEYAAKGKRITSYGFIENNKEDLENLNNINLLAIAILDDPIRKGVGEAIEVLNSAGIKTYIVTGDYANTAKTIAQKLNIKGEVLTGNQAEKMSDEDFIKQLEKVRIFARFPPLDKLRLVKLLQKQNEIVGTIGDGVNDAPAIKTANIGIAMGQIGTDVAKEAATLILTDDNYVHIPDAVKICRKALDNFSKGLGYYLCAKAILLSIFIVPLFFAIPFSFAPIHIIFIELLMDLASSTIFVTESEEPGLMQKSPKDFVYFLDKKLIYKIIYNGIGLTLGILLIYFWIYFKTNNLILAQTSALVTWLIGHILLALNLKQNTSLFKHGILKNKLALYWLLGMILFSLAITNFPIFFSSLKTTYLSFNIWVTIIFVTIISTFWIELKKIYFST